MAVSRRKLLLGSAAAVAGSAAGSLAWINATYNPHTPLHDPFPDHPKGSGTRPATPGCGDLDHPVTVPVIEGPFYKPDSPERRVLRQKDTIGRPLVIEGRVMTPDCRPIAGAVLDFWSCDGDGVYDNDGYRLRGHQFTSPDGAFRVETVKPKHYGNRTAHVHVKAQAPNTPLLTTQLYFPDEPLNAKDWFFKDNLLLSVTEAGGGSLLGSFDFVLAKI